MGARRPVRPEEYSPPTKVVAEPEGPWPTIEMAVSAFLADGQDRGNSDATIYKKRIIVERLLKRFCIEKGIRFLSELDLNTLRESRSMWNVNSLVRASGPGDRASVVL
jgi:hypothetical protein